jgi:hypothetical protein
MWGLKMSTSPFNSHSYIYTWALLSVHWLCYEALYIGFQEWRYAAGAEMFVVCCIIIFLWLQVDDWFKFSNRLMLVWVSTTCASDFGFSDIYPSSTLWLIRLKNTLIDTQFSHVGIFLVKYAQIYLSKKYSEIYNCGCICGTTMKMISYELLLYLVKNVQCV